MQAFQFCTFVMSDNTIGYKLLTFLIFRHLAIISYLSFWIQICIDKNFCHDKSNLLCIVRVISLHRYIINLRTDTKSCVGRERPRSRCPCSKTRLTPFCPLFFRINCFKKSCTCCILYITITTRLVQLMTRKTGTSSRRIRLNRIAFIEQALVIKLAK